MMVEIGNLKSLKVQYVKKLVQDVQVITKLPEEYQKKKSQF